MTRALGIVGILGGLAVLAAFVVDIPPAVNSIRIVLFHVGAIAIAVAVHPRQARVSRGLALAGAVPLVLANAWALGWFLLGLERERPFAGDFGLIGFYAGLAFWCADAWFGLITFRIGVLWRPASLFIAVGSLLAVTGIDRLKLTTPANPTIFEPASLLGIGLNGLAWVLIGIQVALSKMRPALPTSSASAPARAP